MNPPKVTDIDYIHFLIAAQRVYTWVEAAQSAPNTAALPAHDAFVRLLHRQPPDTPALWQDMAPYVQPTTGLLLLDDTTLDKPYTRKTALVTRQWRGKQQQVVAGINSADVGVDGWAGHRALRLPGVRHTAARRPHQQRPRPRHACDRQGPCICAPVGLL